MKVTTRRMLACGAIAGGLYIATDLTAAVAWDGYSITDQTVSETFAVGAPTRPFVLARSLTYSILMLFFGWGVLRVASEQRSLRTTGGLIVAIGAIDLLGPFAPMHQRAVLEAGGGSLTDIMHIVLASFDVLLILLILGFGAHTAGKKFRLYSFITLVLVLGFGALTGLDGPRMSSNLPTPMMGIWERISIYGFMIWLIVFAVTLLRSRHDGRST